jgi:DNA-binding protein H-NS
MIEMAKAVRSRRKNAARKAPTMAKRKAAQPGVTSAKIRALVYNLSTQELDELITVAVARKNEEMTTARASFLDDVKAKAASLGMSLADLVGLGNGRAAVKETSAGGSGPPAKFRNPKTGETWSGRGRPARWITELEAKGRKREEFRVR